jgi:hypothetical protein
MNKKMYKYGIEDYLYSLNVMEYRKAVKLIPEILGIALNTFQNYRKILIDDSQDIPYEKVVMMEKLFDLNPGTLTKNKFEVKSLKELF